MAKFNDARAIEVLNEVEDLQAKYYPGYEQQYFGGKT
jgi:hypothetical protein